MSCVPKKLYVYASEYSSDFRDSRGFGWKNSEPHFDWLTLRNHKIIEISRLNGIYETILENANVNVIHGRGKIIDSHTVEVSGKTYTTERILIAVGGWPYIPDISGKELVITSNEIFDLEQFPKRLVVVGGGYIAVEFASIFNGLGSEVTQLYRGNLFLRGFDNEIRQFTDEEIRKKGIKLPRFNS